MSEVSAHSIHSADFAAAHMGLFVSGAFYLLRLLTVSPNQKQFLPIQLLEQIGKSDELR